MHLRRCDQRVPKCTCPFTPHTTVSSATVHLVSASPVVSHLHNLRDAAKVTKVKVTQTPGSQVHHVTRLPSIYLHECPFHTKVPTIVASCPRVPDLPDQGQGFDAAAGGTARCESHPPPPHTHTGLRPSIIIRVPCPWASGRPRRRSGCCRAPAPPSPGPPTRGAP